jgi:aldehyde dehydrogenase
MSTSIANVRDIDVSAIVAEVVRRLQKPSSSMANNFIPQRASNIGNNGVFATVDAAVMAAAKAQAKIGECTLEERGKIVDIIKKYCVENAERLGRMEFEESRIGRVDHKIQKLQIIPQVLGVEAMKTNVLVTSSGADFIAAAPFGVIGMVTPATHSIPTMASNAINVIAAGNAAVFSPHPAAYKCFQHALEELNQLIIEKVGIENCITTMENPTIEAAGELFKHPNVPLITVTGGPAVVKSAMRAGKRVIAAGPGNPPVVVDETADLDSAAKHIIAGAAFDNNLLCIGDKEVFVVESVFDAFMAAMRKAGAKEFDRGQIQRLTEAVFVIEKANNRIHVNRDFIGKDTDVLGIAAGVALPKGVDLLFGETDENHPFVVEEQMMPFLPIVCVKDVDAAILAAYRAEHGYKHTAMIHTKNEATARKMARMLNTTLFVKNGPCTASLGIGGPGYLSFSIATPTGEGVTTPLTFTRQRQMVIGGRYDFY